MPEVAEQPLQKICAEAAAGDKKVKEVSRWISKRLIRSAGMICMWKGDFFTMEVPLLAEMVATHYQDKKEEVKKLLEYANTPTTDKQAVLKILDSFGNWLIREDDRVFGKC